MRRALVAALVALTLVSCQPDAEGVEVGTLDQGRISGDINYVVIDGMPCLVWTSGYKGGLTCDWTKWEGEP